MFHGMTWTAACGSAVRGREAVRRWVRKRATPSHEAFCLVARAVDLAHEAKMDRDVEELEKAGRIC